MDGPESAGTRVAGWLRDRMPAKLRQLEARLSLPEGSLADPERVLDHDAGPIPIEDWPAIYCLPQRTRRTALVDTDQAGAETYRVTYVVQVLMWVRHDSYAETDALRKRYALAVRECLLDRKTLALPGTALGLATVDPSSITENYSPVATDDGRTIAAAELSVDVHLIEVLAGLPAIGVVDETVVDTVLLPPRYADTIGVDTGLVPPHPAL